MTTKEKKEIRKAVAYGMGFICGRHNLELTKTEVKKIAREYVNRITKES